MKRLDWNAVADAELNGVRGEDVLRAALETLRETPCECAGPCPHVAAAGVLGILRIVEHRDDCPECAALRGGEP